MTTKTPIAPISIRKARWVSCALALEIVSTSADASQATAPGAKRKHVRPPALDTFSGDRGE